MSGFKEMALKDIEETFFNVDEFGEKHIIDGKAMMVIVDGLEVVERQKKQSEHGQIDGIFKKQIVLFVRKSDFGPFPPIGCKLRMDDSYYLIEDAIDEGGVYSITLGAVKS